MKSYEEMANDALKRIREHNAEKRRKKKIAVKMIATAFPALIVTVAGVGIWKSGLMTPPDNHLLIENQIIVTTENNKTTYISTEKTDEDIITTTESTDTNNTEIINTKSQSSTIINDSVQNTEEALVVSDNSVQNTEETIVTSDDSIQNAGETLVISDDNSYESGESEENPVIIDNNIPVVTDAPVFQTPTEYIYVESVSSSTYAEETETYIDADRLGDAYINDDYFIQDTNIDLSEYTLGECIGNATDFEGYYKDVNFDVTFYYAMEDVNIVLVKFSDGRTLALKKQNDTSFYNPEN